MTSLVDIPTLISYSSLIFNDKWLFLATTSVLAAFIILQDYLIRRKQPDRLGILIEISLKAFGGFGGG